MKDQRPRKQFNFETIETRPELNYVPPKTRDPRRIELFESKPPGYVIAWQQKIGIQASSTAFERITSSGNIDDVRQLSGVLSVAAIGTAYHTFAAPEKDELMYRKIRLPLMIDPETNRRTTEDDLFDQASAGLAHAAELAAAIEEVVLEQRDPKKYNEKLGRSLATTGFTLAVISAETSALREDEAGMQLEAWKAARSASTLAIELSGAMGARPTLAQLADEQSPLRRYMYDHHQFVSAPVHAALYQ